MSKPRLPTDIDFLLESVMAETPDRVQFSPEDVQKLKATGRQDIKPGGMNWHRNDTRAFFVHADAQVVPYISATHQDLEDQLKFMAREAEGFPNDFSKAFTSYVDETGNINVVDNGNKHRPIGFYGLDNRYNIPGISVRRYLQKNFRFLRSFEIRGDDENVSGPVPAGRVWWKKDVVSFWNDKHDIEPHLKLIFGFLESLKVNKQKCVYEFLGIKGFFTYEELFKSNHGKETLSPEEIVALRKIQHIDPRAKEKLTPPEYKDERLKKAARGFDNAAKMNAMMPALEETIRLKKMVPKGAQ